MNLSIVSSTVLSLLQVIWINKLVIIIIIIITTTANLLWEQLENCIHPVVVFFLLKKIN